MTMIQYIKDVSIKNYVTAITSHSSGTFDGYQQMSYFNKTELLLIVLTPFTNT